MKRKFGKSLAMQKFTKTIENQIRNYWQIQTSLIYSERWWKSVPTDELPKTLSQYPGDNSAPFTSIDIAPAKYIENTSNVLVLNREGAIVNFITAFEVYIFDIFKRVIFISPESVGDSSMELEAGLIGTALSKKNIREWFSQKIADKYLRNLTHLKMILKIQGIIKRDFKKTYKQELEEWNKWTYVRNAIIHSGREVSEDLSNVWPDRFPIIGEPLRLTDKDCVRIHWLAMLIAGIIDDGALEHHIELADASLLVREFFIRDGVDDAKELSRRIYKILGLKMKSHEVDKVLGYQRRTSSEIEGWAFSHYNFQP